MAQPMPLLRARAKPARRFRSGEQIYASRSKHSPGEFVSLATEAAPHPNPREQLPNAHYLMNAEEREMSSPSPRRTGRGLGGGEISNCNMPTRFRLNSASSSLLPALRPLSSLHL